MGNEGAAIVCTEQPVEVGDGDEVRGYPCLRGESLLTDPGLRRHVRDGRRERGRSDQRSGAFV